MRCLPFFPLPEAEKCFESVLDGKDVVCCIGSKKSSWSEASSSSCDVDGTICSRGMTSSVAAPPSTLLSELDTKHWKMPACFLDTLLMINWCSVMVICGSAVTVWPLNNHDCCGGGLPLAAQSKATRAPSSTRASFGALTSDTGSVSWSSVDAFSRGAAPPPLDASHV